MTRIALFALVALLPACVIGPVHEETDELTFDGPVDAVVFSLESGDASIRTADVDQVVVTRTFRYRGGRPKVSARLAGGTLDITSSCPDMNLGTCSVHHEILLPTSAAIRGDTGSGDVAIAGLEHRVEVSTGSGDIDVKDIFGDLDLSTGSGDIVGDGLVSDRVAADTGSGDVALDIDAQPHAVDIDTGSGDVDLGVTSGAYRIQIDTGSGDETLRGVMPDPSAEHVVRIDTGSGDVHIVGR